LTGAGPADNTNHLCAPGDPGTGGCPPAANTTPNPTVTAAPGTVPARNRLLRSYDALGRVATETNADAVTAWAYDGLDPVYVAGTAGPTEFLRDADGALLGQDSAAAVACWDDGVMMRI
jgi:hypothetical protein